MICLLFGISYFFGATLYIRGTPGKYWPHRHLCRPIVSSYVTAEKNQLADNVNWWGNSGHWVGKMPQQLVRKENNCLYLVM